MSETIALVLAGGGARGAYEAGVLRELLPWLDRRGQRPSVVVGTSVGALNTAFAAARADEPALAVARAGWERWERIAYDQVLEPFASVGELETIGRLPLSALLPRVRPWSLLDPAPLAATLRETIPFPRIRRNVEAGVLGACAVVATAAHSNRSVVFHAGGPDPDADARRRIDYVRATIGVEHVLASAAIPVAFPAVEVRSPRAARAWYFDGGTRLNTPIKPALALGADRVVVVALNSLAAARARRERADLFDGAGQIIQGLLVDPLVNDVQTLATINEAVLDGAAPPPGRRLVPYILIAPRTPDAVGRIASEVYEETYADLLHSPSRDLSLLGRVIDAGGSPTRGELFSAFFFAPEFAQRLLAEGRRDARRWIRSAHDDDGWQLRTLAG